MDVAEQPTSPAFYRLPEELLTMIIEDHIIRETAGIWRCLNDFPTLKSLRLACRQYAYLPRLNAALFYGMRLVASPRHVEIAETTDLSYIKPYVKRIVFEPTKYSWDMTYEIFKEILMIGPCQDICDRENEKLREIAKTRENGYSGLLFLGDRDIGEQGWKAFMEKYWEGEAPFSEAAIQEGYRTYMQHANETRKLFENGSIRNAWTKLLKQLPDVGMFRIGFWDFDSTLPLRYREETKDKSWKELGCTIYEHHHGYGDGHNHVKCRRLQEPVGEELFSHAIASLIAAGSVITQLDIKCVVNGDFAWADDGQISALNLSKLHTLLFRPRGAEIMEMYHTDKEKSDHINARCGYAATELLKKCASSIKNLELLAGVSSCACDWPPAYADDNDNDDIVALPALERFNTGTGLNLSAFAEFVHRATNLKRLELDCCHGQDGQWRDLWRAIRHHPSRMQLEIDQIPCNDCAEISMSHYTGEKSSDEGDPDDPWMNINHSLENYLSNMGRWDESCRMWFEDEDGGNTDEDEQDSDAEDVGDTDMGEESEDDNENEE